MSAHDSRIPAQLESRIELSDGLAVFRFILERDFAFNPGQYATLWLTHGGKTLARPYSIASSPSESRALEFYINLVREGKLTPSLWQADVIDGLRNRDPETKAAVTGPKGHFILDPGDPRDLVLIASGTGLAPFISMIRKQYEDYRASPKNFRERRIYLIHGVSYPSHLGYREELEKLASEATRGTSRKLSFLYFPTISRPFMDSTWKGLKGRAETLLDVAQPPKTGHPSLEDCIRSMLNAILRPETHVVYVCGYPGTVDNVVDKLIRRGFQLDSDIKREKYYP